MIAAGKLNKFLAFYAPSAELNAMGEATGDPVLITEAWACIQPIAPADMGFARTFAPTVSHKITVYFNDAINEKLTAKLGDRSFIINGMINPDEADEDLVLFCTEARA